MQILKALDNQCINKLENYITRYATVTPLEVLTHLWINYRKIDTDDLAQNEERIKN